MAGVSGGARAVCEKSAASGAARLFVPLPPRFLRREQPEHGALERRIAFLRGEVKAAGGVAFRHFPGFGLLFFFFCLRWKSLLFPPRVCRSPFLLPRVGLFEAPYNFPLRGRSRVGVPPHP